VKISNKKRFLILIFVVSFFSGVLGLRLLLTAMGVPSFDVVLTTLFGEGNPWALVFSITLILLIVFGLSKAIERYNVQQVK